MEADDRYTDPHRGKTREKEGKELPKSSSLFLHVMATACHPAPQSHPIKCNLTSLTMMRGGEGKNRS